MDLSDYRPTPDLSRAATIPARWCTGPEFLSLEKERVFARTWQPVGYTEWVANAGDHFACGIQVMIASQSLGVLRALLR